MLIKRRDFIKLIGGISGAALLGGFALDELIDVPEQLVEAVKSGPGIESWKNTVCRQCPGGCGISVRLVDGVPVSIKGNPHYPVNQGGMCPLGLSGLQNLFHPERLKTPLRRVGLHGSGSWEPVAWEDALSRISERLIELRRGGRSHEVAFLGSDESAMMSDLISHFMRSYGSPNYYRFSQLTNDSVPFQLTHGTRRIPSYDLLNATYVLSFGANFLEEGYSPVYYTKLYSRMRDRADGVRTEFVSVDSRMNLTAANSDHWVPIRPGTYAALALGIAYVLIREEMYDAEFVRDHTFGFSDWVDAQGRSRLGFRSLVLEGYYPERVQEITDVPAETILDIARSFGNAQRPVALSGSAATDQSNGTYGAMAIHGLNALMGNIHREGGVFFVDPPPFEAIAEVLPDDVATAGLDQPKVATPRDGTFPVSEFSIDSFTENILAGKPYPISVIFLYGGNPLFRTLNHHRFAEALKRVPLIVSFDSFVSETSEYADLILPDHSFLERWDAVSDTPSVGFVHVGVQQPVVDPFYDTRNSGDVLIDIASRVGGTTAGSTTYDDFQSLLHDRVRGVFDSGEGAVVSEGVQEYWIEYLQQRGWQIGRYSSYEQFWDLLVENGGWWNPIRRDPGRSEMFNTPSRRYEFYSQALEAAIDALVGGRPADRSPRDVERVLTGLNVQVRGDTVYLPHFESTVGQEDGMPLYLTTFQTLANRDGQAANLPLMQEMFGYLVRRYWRTWAEVHPETAEAYGIHDGDWIWVESSVGSIRVQAVVHPGILPNAISIPFGLGHTSYGRYAAGHGSNPNSIVRNTYDMISGKPALQSTRVRIARAT